MITAEAFLNAARDRGLSFYAGVPCSFLTPVINRVASGGRFDYVAAASEGEAVAIAAGAWLAGRGTVVMCQNSGLGNTINPLTSLNWPFRIPTLLIVTWRGEPGLGDEPQHELMGQITDRLLDDIDVRHEVFPTADEDVARRLDQAIDVMADTGRPFALIMKKGSVGDEALDQSPFIPLPTRDADDLRGGGGRPTRVAALERLLSVVPDAAAIIATTGKCGRELFTLNDRPQHLYQVGSMGCASGMGLGVAMNTPRPIVVLDGDGAALMKLGTLATIGAYGPDNLLHIVLDNGVHDSTGGQATVSPGVDFAAIALACGYRHGFMCDDANRFETAVSQSLAADGPGLIHLRVKPGSMRDLGRPTIPPADVARRFRDFIRAA